MTSASKSAETTADAPALTRSISADEIRRYGITSLAEALDFLGVGVHAEYQLGHAELTVRGVGFAGDRGNHTLLLVDGHIINEALYGDAPIDQRLGVPLELIDHVELVLGPGSAVYGTNAVVAVINVVTKSASTAAGFHVAAEYGAQGSQRITLTTGQQLDVFGKRTSLTAGLTYYRLDDPVDLPKQTLLDPLSGKTYTWGGDAHASNRADVPGMHLRLVRDGLEVVVRATMSDVGDPTGHGDFDNRASGARQQRASVSVRQSFPLGRFGDVTATVYGDTFRERQRIVASRTEVCTTIATCTYATTSVSNRVGADVRANLDWFHDGRFVTLAGVGATLDHIDAQEGLNDNATGRALGGWHETANFDSVLTLSANAQQTWRPFSWLDLSGGARVDWRKVDDDDEVYQFNPVLTPRAAVTARPWDGASVKLLHAQAFRDPNPYELDGHSAILIQSHGLDPERTFSDEVTFEQRAGNHRVMFGLFHTKYDDIINRTLLTASEAQAAAAAGLTPAAYDANLPLSQYRADRTIASEGFNASIDGAAMHQRLRWGASFSGTHARVDDQLIPISPAWFGKARASYDFGGELPTFALASTFAGRALNDRSLNSGFMRLAFAPPSLEVRATLTGPVPWVKGLSYRAIVAAQAHSRTPFAIGPTFREQPGVDSATLAPSTPWNAFLGLQYDF